jgi:hypothetical protein
MKDARTLTDEELEDCVDGSTNIGMLRDILTKHGVVDEQGWIDPEIFADWFAAGVEGYISAEPDTDEWQAAYDTNWNWGYDIGDNINSYISDNFTNE